jgi:hypothetical protein
MKYPGEDLSEIDREYNILSKRLRVLELKQTRDTEEARTVDLVGRWTQNELVNLATKFCLTSMTSVRVKVLCLPLVL